MIGWILNFISGNKQHPVRVHDIELKKEDKIVLDSGVEETVEEPKEILNKAIQKVFKDLNALTPEEFDAEIKKYMSFEEGECHPDECEGECDAMGWCEIATEYRTKTDHRRGR
jgi:hypothetical protein